MGFLSGRKPISTKPGGPHADKGTPTEYKASRGGWYTAQEESAGDSDANGGRRSGLWGRRR
ncbi:hypothetical protein ACFUCH_35500 [Streptomyces olivaceus]|uniref:hypothetical protein n=1 Tax=Streptomyces olivaceus TaxID=47716 RepID=UPI003626208C